MIVLGMHRAGTSLTTRIINMMGAYVAPEGMLLAANSDNPKGFWERLDILDVNTGLLRHFGASWYKLDKCDVNVHTLPDALVQHMQLIAGEFEAHTPWVAKDPRFCITLPCWLPILKPYAAVIVSRDPREIAHSLSLRNDMPSEYGLALWEYYAVHVIRNAHVLPKIFVHYDAMITAPVKSTAALHESLTATGIEGLSLPSDAALKQFIDPALYRAKVSGALALSAHQKTLAAMLRGEEAFDANVEVSATSQRIMQTLGSKVSGSAKH